MERINLKGLGVALITPFKEDETIEQKAFEYLELVKNEEFKKIDNIDMKLKKIHKNIDN